MYCHVKCLFYKRIHKNRKNNRKCCEWQKKMIQNCNLALHIVCLTHKYKCRVVCLSFAFGRNVNWRNRLLKRVYAQRSEDVAFGYFICFLLLLLFLRFLSFYTLSKTDSESEMCTLHKIWIHQMKLKCECKRKRA